jgi:hypothetical protein
VINMLLASEKGQDFPSFHLSNTGQYRSPDVKSCRLFARRRHVLNTISVGYCEEGIGIDLSLTLSVDAYADALPPT